MFLTQLCALLPLCYPEKLIAPPGLGGSACSFQPNLGKELWAPHSDGDKAISTNISVPGALGTESEQGWGLSPTATHQVTKSVQCTQRWGLGKATEPCTTYLEFPGVPQKPGTVFVVRLCVTTSPVCQAEIWAGLDWSPQEVLRKTIIIHFPFLFKGPEVNKVYFLVQLWEANQSSGFRGEQIWNSNGIFQAPWPSSCFVWAPRLSAGHHLPGPGDAVGERSCTGLTFTTPLLPSLCVREFRMSPVNATASKRGFAFKNKRVGSQC